MKKIVFILLFTFLFISHLYSQESAQNPIGNVLDNNGRIIPGTSGGFSASEYSMTTGENGEPLFSKESVSSGSWSGPGPFLSSSVTSIAVIGSIIYVGGQFQAGGGSPASYLIQYNGGVWSAVGGGVNSDVICLTVSGTDLYAGGFFSDAGGSGASKIAKWDGANWSSLGGGINNARVRAICVSGNLVYAAGEFTHMGDVFANHIAVWNGIYWDSLGHGTDADVWAMSLSGNDLYVGGFFTHAGGIAANYIARWNNGWHTMGTGVAGLTPASTAYCIAVTATGNKVYIGGLFTQANGVQAENIAVWNGTNFSPLGSGLSFEVHSIVVAGSNIYSCGLFAASGSDTINKVGKWNGTTWSALDHGVDDGNAYVLYQNGNDLYMGGTFLNVSGVFAQFLAKWHDTGINSTSSPIVSGGGFINFNTTAVTSASISINSGAGSGIINVFKNTGILLDSTGIAENVSDYSWIINQSGLSVPFTGKLRFKISEIPDNGVTNPNTVHVYSRSTPGSGTFTQLTTVYLAGSGELEADVTSFSEFVLGSPTDALPVELASFTSLVSDRNVNLNWSTVSEQNNSGFQIEQLVVRENNNEWSNIGFVQGGGTTNEIKNYSFTDRNLSEGRYSYRLKQIDYNGNFKYYVLANEVVIGVPQKYSLSQNYPNPFNPVTRINYELPVANYVSIKIFDVNGKLVKELVNENQNAGAYSVDFNAVSFPSGTYFYRIKAGEFNDTKKMILVK